MTSVHTRSEPGNGTSRAKVPIALQANAGYLGTDPSPAREKSLLN